MLKVLYITISHLPNLLQATVILWLCPDSEHQESVGVLDFEIYHFFRNKVARG